MSKIIIISGPSGTGKGTVIKELMQDPALNLSFSISATNRSPRGEEQDGVEYYFLSDKEFAKKIKDNLFIEYVEVYPGRFYGTLKSELDRIEKLQSNLLLDIDVEGAIQVKELYQSQALSIFLSPPSLEALGERLKKRGTETLEQIEGRLDRASYELSFANRFDCNFINDNLSECVEETKKAVLDFLYS